MHIESTRFGRVDVRDDSVITFPKGLIGLPGIRYVLLAQDEGSAFYWLHSVDDPAIALPVANPWLFFADYEVEVSDEDVRTVGLSGAADADIFCVVRAAERLDDFTINLRGPLVMNGQTRVAVQTINEAGDYQVRQPLFAAADAASAAPSTPAVPVAATGV
jgi:flagellar assembly factor FliW